MIEILAASALTNLAAGMTGVVAAYKGIEHSLGMGVAAPLLFGVGVVSGEIYLGAMLFDVSKTQLLPVVAVAVMSAALGIGTVIAGYKPETGSSYTEKDGVKQ